ncbi:hypothetical protein BvCmsHHNP008_01615 [Escherichia coli]|nr:hypothetical protein BvCms1485_04369 [Escherichia coli]GCO90345.1 hypothetical protein BvCms244_04084 [Escherichia coli]GCQ83968.1 hypothetical protein BvCmsHHNP008_01615 [Escherichia coli]GDH53990.1 hypothetical protein BvCmsKKNP020_04539 [Escherichia coli]GDI87437.1 hypothetical protein BvCmsKKNP025_01676 [Escherichia coli]
MMMTKVSVVIMNITVFPEGFLRAILPSPTLYGDFCALAHIFVLSVCSKILWPTNKYNYSNSTGSIFSPHPVWASVFRQ